MALSDQADLPPKPAQPGQTTSDFAHPCARRARFSLASKDLKVPARYPPQPSRSRVTSEPDNSAPLPLWIGFATFKMPVHYRCLNSTIPSRNSQKTFNNADRLKNGFPGISGGSGCLVFGLRKYALGRPPARKPFDKGSY